MSDQGQHESKHLFDLPQEILDMIFDLAYPRAGQLVTRQEWEREEKRYHQSEPTYTKRPFPSLKVNEFVVSKAFLDCAAKAWMQNLSPISSRDISYHLLQKFKTGAQSIFLKHIRSLRIEPGDVVCMLCMVYLRSLKEVELMIEIERLEPSSSTTAWETLLSDSDLRDTAAYSAILGTNPVGNNGLRGLTRFRAIPDDLDALQEPYNTIFQANVAKFEALVMPIVTQPRPLPGVETKKNPKEAVEFTKATAGGSPLRDDRIPEDIEQLCALAQQDPQNFIAWIKEAKEAKKSLEALDR